MVITYKYRLKLTKAQEQRICNWMGVCRMVYNMALEIKSDAYKKGIKISFFDLGKQLKDIRKDYEWVSDVSASTLGCVIRQLEQSYKRFFSGGGFPKFKSKRENTAIHFRQDYRQKILRQESIDSFNLPKFGTLRIFKDRPCKGDILNATITKECNEYYLHI